MMGRENDGQGQLLYHFDLEELVPPDHLLRGIDRFLDFTELRDGMIEREWTLAASPMDPECTARVLGDVPADVRPGAICALMIAPRDAIEAK